MATKYEDEPDRFVNLLRNSSWSDLPLVISQASQWLDKEPLGTSGSEMVAAAIATLATHEKWEVRRAVAVVAGTSRLMAFEDVLYRLTVDANARVQHAAEHASLRRRDWRAAGLLGREHEERLDRVLDNVQTRFGTQARLAVRRAAEEMTSTFARELYHEMVRHLTPLDREVRRLQSGLIDGLPTARLVEYAEQVKQDVSQVKAVLKAMREYAATPELRFLTEDLRDIVSQAVRTAEPVTEEWGVPIKNNVGERLTATVSRARLVQALSNLIYNAVESYTLSNERSPIVIEAAESDAAIAVSIRDQGAGMPADTIADARTLFSTTKPQGTGVGLPLAIKIVESEHDGRLEIESTENRGTTVRVSLPRYRKT